jgi:hypothetical protein
MKKFELLLFIIIVAIISYIVYDYSRGGDIGTAVEATMENASEKFSDMISEKFDKTSDTVKEKAKDEIQAKAEAVTKKAVDGVTETVTDAISDVSKDITATDQTKEAEAIQAAQDALTDYFGKTDEATGNDYSFRYTKTVTIDSVNYYIFEMSWLVGKGEEGAHYSHLSDVAVSQDLGTIGEYYDDLVYPF